MIEVHEEIDKYTIDKKVGRKINEDTEELNNIIS